MKQKTRKNEKRTAKKRTFGSYVSDMLRRPRLKQLSLSRKYLKDKNLFCSLVNDFVELLGDELDDLRGRLPQRVNVLSRHDFEGATGREKPDPNA